MKSWNVPGNSFRMSKNPDIGGKSQINNSGLLALTRPEWPYLGDLRSRHLLYFFLRSQGDVFVWGRRSAAGSCDTDAQGRYFPSQKSKNPENGFPEGRLHQTGPLLHGCRRAIYMATYAYKCRYMAIQHLKCVFWMSGLVFWMSGLVFWVSGLVFGCLDLYLGVWTCFLSVWTCILDTVYL